ncbi:hypothetical protein LX16_0876 [Stackebrandtia albiflava]|uniref:Uncharacterized protein n=1 Tax=Stackebrandtia albiflava TaxID=406432 RepID=A0A562VBB7_9ACTN|nr:hypothetical protein [Stackebrandtia albiflava]TWJ15176.1 hypothetical protein LX16_0876 [Stackebrandtia albiflava]
MHSPWPPGTTILIRHGRFGTAGWVLRRHRKDSRPFGDAYTGNRPPADWSEPASPPDGWDHPHRTLMWTSPGYTPAVAG